MEYTLYLVATPTKPASALGWSTLVCGEHHCISGGNTGYCSLVATSEGIVFPMATSISVLTGGNAGSTTLSGTCANRWKHQPAFVVYHNAPGIQQDGRRETGSNICETRNLRNYYFNYSRIKLFYFFHKVKNILEVGFTNKLFFFCTRTRTIVCCSCA